MVFTIWDDETGNRIASFDSMTEARGFLREMLEANGPKGVRDLAVIAYPDDDSDPALVLEGADFLAQTPIPARV